MTSFEFPNTINHKRSKRGDKDVKLKSNIAVKFADGDKKRTVCLLSSSESVAQGANDTSRLLKLKQNPKPFFHFTLLNRRRKDQFISIMQFILRIRILKRARCTPPKSRQLKLVYD